MRLLKILGTTDLNNTRCRTLFLYFFLSVHAYFIIGIWADK
jgi:hypothetical protein